MLIGTSIINHPSIWVPPWLWKNLHVDHWGKRIPTEHISQDGTMVEDTSAFTSAFTMAFTMVFPMKSSFFPRVFPFSHGFPRVFPFSHGFPMVFPFSHGFPMVFPRFSHGQAEGATRRHARRKQRTKTCPSSALQRHGSSGGQWRVPLNHNHNHTITITIRVPLSNRSITIIIDMGVSENRLNP